MRKLALAFLLVLVVVLVPAPAHAERGCVINVLGVRVCGELVGQPLPEVVTVTVRPDPIRVPGPTVTVPGPPGPTVKVPGPETTVTETVTVSPKPVPSETPDAVPDETQTTQAPSPTIGQEPSPSATIGPDDRDEDAAVDFSDGKITVQEVGIGFLTLLALVGLLLVAMWAGYVLGYKDKERKDTNFMRALLDSVKSR